MNDVLFILVLLFPFVFFLHEMEELSRQRRWINTYKDNLGANNPRVKAIFDKMVGFNTKAFSVAIAEEFLVVAFVTAYFLLNGAFAKYLWLAVFIAYSAHFFMHVVQAMAVRGYVPGLVTAVVCLPYANFAVLCMAVSEPKVSILPLLLCAALGYVFWFYNHRFAHALGSRLCK